MPAGLGVVLLILAAMLITGCDRLEKTSGGGLVAQEIDLQVDHIWPTSPWAAPTSTSRCR